MLPDIIEPVEDIDFFRIKRVRYELHVEGTVFVTADEECDDFNIAAHRIDLSEPTVVGRTVLHSVERCIDDPTKAFDRIEWIRDHNVMKAGDRKRPESESTLDTFTEAD